MFFTTLESFALRDTNEQRDAYEWTEGETQLISTGTGRRRLRAVSVSADGKNAFFFTRDNLVPEDENGSTVKIYDGPGGRRLPRSIPRPLPCAAVGRVPRRRHAAPRPRRTSTPRPAPESRVAAGHRQTKKCKKGKVKSKGQCVKKKQEEEAR